MKAMKPQAAVAGPWGRTARALGLALLFLPAACVSLKISLPDDPQEVVAALAVVAGDPAALDLERPLADETIEQGSEAVHALIKVLNVNRPLSLQWHWYSPENLRVRLSRSVTVNARGRTLAYFAAWDSLPQKNFAGKPGRWTVAITAGGLLLARKEFTLK